MLYGALNMSSVQNYIRDIVVQELKTKLQTDLGISEVHIQPFNTVELKGVYLFDKSGNRILLAERLFANIDIPSLFYKEIVVNTVHLSDFEINLNKQTKDSPLNIQFVIDAFKSEDKESKPLFRLKKINGISITDGSFNYNVNDAPQKSGEFDANHISINDFNAHLAIKAVDQDSLNINVKSLSLKEKSGLIVDNLIVRVLKSGNDVWLKGFKLDLPKSFLQLDKLIVTLPAGDKGIDMLSGSELSCEIASSYIVPSDIAAFVPQLSNFKERLVLQASLGGRIDSLQLNNLTLDYGDRMHLSTNAWVKNVRDKDQLYLRGVVSEFRITKDGFDGLLDNLLKDKKQIPSQLGNLGAISFHGNIEGSLKNLLAKGNLNTALGGVAADLNFGFNPSESINSFFIGNVSTEDFKLGSLLQQPNFDLLSFNLSLDVKKPVKGNINGSVSGLIDRVDFKGYSYKNIELDGDYDGLKYDGKIHVDGDYGYFSANGLFDLSKEVPVFDFIAHVRNVKLDKLHLVDKFKDSSLSAVVRANFEGKHIDDLQGQVSVDSLSFLKEGKRFDLERLSVEAKGTSHDRLLTLSSDIINGEVKGSYSFSDLIPNIKRTFNSYLPALVNLKPDVRKRHAGHAPMQNNFDMHFTIGNTEQLSDMFNIPAILFKEATINGSYDSENDKFNVQADLPSCKVAGMALESTTLNVDNNVDAIQVEIATTTFGKNNVKNQINIDILAANDLVDSKIRFSNDSKQKAEGTIVAATSFNRDNYTSSLETNINIRPSNILLNEVVWNFDESFVKIRDGAVIVDNFLLANSDQSQFIKADGRYSAKNPTDILLLNLQHIDLEYVFTTLNIPALEFGGFATGQIAASSIEGKPYAKADLKVKDMKFNNAELGDLELFSELDKETMRVELKGILSGENRKIANIDGYINPLKSTLSLNFDAKKINIAFLNKYASTLFNNIGGVGSGQVRLFGDFKNVTVEGRAFIEDGTLGINFLNTSYSFTDSVYMKSDLIYFNNIKLNDYHGNAATVSGKIVHNYFADFLYHVDLQGDNFMLFNATEKQNPVFYGKVFGSGLGSIYGDEREVNINARIKTNKNTLVRMNFMEETVNQYSFITYKDNNPDNDTIQVDKPKKYVPPRMKTPDGVTMNMNFFVEATPDATAELIMDPVGGDVLKGNGSGSIQFKWSSNSDPELYGTYNIQYGTYNFTFQKILERKFVIESGSTVFFRGDPFAALLDVTAIYRLNANLADLDQGLATRTGQSSVPVQCILNLSGELQHPAVKLDLALPNADSEIQRQVKNLVSSEDMMNRQIVYLLLLSKFYTPDHGRVDNKTSDLASVASATLSSQLGNMLSQIDDRWQVGANVRTNDQGFTSTEVELMLSSRLLNNKLLINGNFGYRDSQAQTTVISDVDIEYLIGNSNTWRIKAYNHFNDKYYYYSDLDNTQIQGLGIMYKRDFDHLREIFGVKNRITPIENKNDSTIIIPDSTQIGSTLAPFIRIKE
ncbi:translocation/assembly module TamB domain-containing protein [Dysgonomonas sp. 520]|uniref:translocation/assembly module TamB domain-containing protein n=1 Tax=Dysgonomonas sp. 520 TaxID=2302931 RepID=UPI0013D85B6F|nr:translocation/assembly module TamB domain-containing protein [Dysgonomonas sp. 520]NDW09896.1 translocation/assembly module TamB [Dysgonomonas sp. 520]